MFKAGGNGAIGVASRAEDQKEGVGLPSTTLPTSQLEGCGGSRAGEGSPV